MLKTLLKTRMIALFSSLFRFLSRKSRAKTAGNLGAAIALGVFVGGCLLFSVGTMFFSLAQPLVQAGLGWLSLSVAALLYICLSFFGSVFITQKQLFDARDNELLLSMPIPPSYILASRFLMLLLLQYLYALLVFLPVGVVYCLLTGVTAARIALLLAGFLLLPLLSLSLVCLLGWLIALLTARLKRKNLFSMLFTLLFLAAYLYVFMNLQQHVATLVANGTAIAASIQRTLPPVYAFGAAIGQGSLWQLFLLALWCLIPAIVVYAVLSRSFIHIATTKRGGVKAVYKEKPMKAGGATGALLRKEWLRFVSLPAYMLNCSLGALFLLILAGGLLWKGSTFIAAFEGIPGGQAILPASLAAGMSFCALMSCTTAPSLSLEGRSFWQLKSLPVTAGQVLIAKFWLNLIVMVPFILIAAVVSWFIVPMTVPQAAVVLLLPLMAQIFSTLFGLLANLLFPRFDWENETLVIKQSGSTLLSVLGGMALLMVLAVLYVAVFQLVMSLISYLWLCTVLFAVGSLGLGTYLIKTGPRRFAQLS